MAAFVTLTFDPATGTTTVAEEGRPAWTGAEPDGIVGACATGSLFASCGLDVTIRRVRSDAATVRP